MLTTGSGLDEYAPQNYAVRPFAPFSFDAPIHDMLRFQYALNAGRLDLWAALRNVPGLLPSLTVIMNSKLDSEAPIIERGVALACVSPSPVGKARQKGGHVPLYIERKSYS